VEWADGVADRALSMSTSFLHGSYRDFHVSYVIQGIENTENVYPVFSRLLYEFHHYIIGIVAIANDVLTAQKHLERSLLHESFQLANPLPRIFRQIPYRNIKSGTAPSFKREKANLIHFLSYWKHRVSPHSCSDQTLMRISEGSVGYFHWLQGKLSLTSRLSLDLELEK
jgi:hypothetical protein